jgi:hypothetical protein
MPKTGDRLELERRLEQARRVARALNDPSLQSDWRS